MRRRTAIYLRELNIFGILNTFWEEALLQIAMPQLTKLICSPRPQSPIIRYCKAVAGSCSDAYIQTENDYGGATRGYL